jgi:hypothetical protein
MSAYHFGMPVKVDVIVQRSFEDAAPVGHYVTRRTLPASAISPAMSAYETQFWSYVWQLQEAALAPGAPLW